MHINDALISTVPQVLFDHVVEHLVQQGAKAQKEGTNGIEEGKQCLYRTEDGRRCALGHCFTDAMLSNLYDDEGSIDVLHERQIITGTSLYLQGFLKNLQAAHDNSRSRESWVDRMKELAHHYALTTAKLEELADVAWVAVGSW